MATDTTDMYKKRIQSSRAYIPVEPLQSGSYWMYL